MWIRNKENDMVVEVSVETGGSMIANGYAEPAEAPSDAAKAADSAQEDGAATPLKGKGTK